MKSLWSAVLMMAVVVAAHASDPGVTVAPQNQTNNAGSSADFSVEATNAVSYQWLFQGSNIMGETNSSLSLTNLSTNQAGTYAVLVSSTDTTVSNTALLTVLQGTIVNFQISGFGTGASNVVVELFDHDKPATVENFVHYIRSGAYTNLFFDRLIPGFVLQSGDYDAGDRTNSTPPPSIVDINQTYVQDLQVNNPPLPQQVDSEFAAGPFVSNTKGTLAMALPSGETNGATSAFFFNLVDNSFLDLGPPLGTGPFTVFGRVIGGGEVLDYFNNTNYFYKQPPTNIVYTTNITALGPFSFTNITTNVFYGLTNNSPSNNIFTNGIFDQVFLDPNAQTFTDLPENFYGTNVPANSNLFFVDFSFPDPNAPPIVDTNPPTAAVTFPAAGLVLTNGSSITLQGTAQDDVGLARVFASLVPLNGAYSDLPFGGNAIGTGQWALSLGVVDPGTYKVLVTSQDGAGNLSAAVTQQPLIITAIVTNGVGTVSFTNLSNPSSFGNGVGAALATGTSYAFGAHPGGNQLFLNWSTGGNISISPNVSFTMNAGLVATATFLPNTAPGSIAYTFPAPHGAVTNGTFAITGTLNNVTSAQISCQVFSYATRLAVGPPQQTSGTTDWLVNVTNLAPNRYFVQTVATNSDGNTTVITNDFTVLTQLRVISNGSGTITSNLDQKFLVSGQEYSMRARAARGSVFLSWSDGTHATLNPVETFMMRPGLTLTATFLTNDVPKAISFITPKANARLTNGTITLQGAITPSLTATQVVCQLFLQSNSIASGSSAVIAGTTWGLAQTNLAPGHYVAVAVAYDAEGRSTVAAQHFDVLANVTVVAGSNGKALVNSKFVEVGKEVKVTATADHGYLFDFWSGGISTNGNNPLTLPVSTNLTINATFSSNYFPNIAGTYDGLFFPGSGLSATNSGYFTMKITGTGFFSGRLSFPSRTYSLFGAFDYSGGVGLSGPGLDGTELGLRFFVDLTNGTSSMNGYIEQASWTYFSSVTGYRAVSQLGTNDGLVSGNYVLSIPGSRPFTNTLPGGDSYATVSINDKGAVTVAGNLADNTPISEGTGVSSNGIWPLYVPLYKVKGVAGGMLLGWETNSSPTNFGGLVEWSKPATRGSYYTNAFSQEFSSSAGEFIPPVPATAYQIVFSGGSLSAPVTNALTVNSAGQFTPVGATNQLEIHLVKSVVTGQFLSGGANKAVQFKGAFTSPAAGGSGYVLDADRQTGRFEISVGP